MATNVPSYQNGVPMLLDNEPLPKGIPAQKVKLNPTSFSYHQPASTKRPTPIDQILKDLGASLRKLT